MLVHVLPLQVLTAADGAIYESFDPALRDFYKDKLNDLARLIAQENNFRFEVEVCCGQGAFHDLVGELIQSRQVSLVVMGTRGGGNFLDRLIGSTTTSFMKVAKCPVLAVPAKAHRISLKKIAYASDFTGDDQVFLQQLFALTDPFNSEINIINIKTDGQAHTGAEQPMLQNLSHRFPERKFCIAQVKADTVTAGIKAFVSENQVNVLAVSIHERGLLQDLFHKSISKELVFETTVPLLSIPQAPYVKSAPETAETATLAT